MKYWAGFLLLCVAGFSTWALAQGGNKTQYLPDDVGANNSDFSNCTSTLTNGIYYIDCSGNVILPNGNNNFVELNETPVVLTIAGDLTLGGTDINTLGDQSDLTIDVGENLNPGNNGNTINANMTIAGSINSGNNTDISGGLTISGNVNLGNNSNIEGQVAITGDLNTGQNVNITGDVDAGGNMNIGQNNNITGDISANDININGSNSTVTGDVTADGNLNNNGTIDGNVDVEGDFNNNGDVNGNVNVDGNLNNNGSIEGGYVNAPCTQNNSCGGGEINVDEECDINDNEGPCGGGGGGTDIHHFLVSHNGTALTCEAYQVTVTACANQACDTTVTGASGDEVVVNLAGSSLIANFNGTGAATVSFDIVTVGNYSISLTNNSSFNPLNPTEFTPSDQVTAVDTALRFSGEGPQTAGSDFNLTLEAIRTDNDTQECVSAFGSERDVTITRVCEDPVADAGANSCQLPVNINGSSVDAAQTVTVDFTNSANLLLNYPDVGRMRLQAEVAADTGATLTGSSDAFVVKPWQIAFEAGGTLLSEQTGAAEDFGVFSKAGDTFTVNLQALGENGESLPSFGQESTPESLEVQNHILVGPEDETGATCPGDIEDNCANPGFVSVNGNQVSFSEVGVIRLVAGLLDNDYLGAGEIPNRTSPRLGRFVPDAFEQLTAGFIPTDSCANQGISEQPFFYMGQRQPFQVTLQAVNSNGDPVENYYGAYAKATPEFYAYNDLAQAEPPESPVSISTSRFEQFEGTLSWKNGESRWLDSLGNEISPSLVYSRQPDDSPDGPYEHYTLTWQIDDGEAEVEALTAVISGGDNFGSGTTSSVKIDSAALYYGRMRLENTFGSETDELPVFATAEYYLGDSENRFAVNTADDCTEVVSQAISYISSPDNIAAELLPDNETIALTSGELFDNQQAQTEQFRWLQPNDQRGTFIFELLLDDVNMQLDYLQYDWSGDGDYSENPQAEGTFGIYRGSDRQIYWREVGW